MGLFNKKQDDKPADAPEVITLDDGSTVENINASEVQFLIESNQDAVTLFEKLGIAPDNSEHFTPGNIDKAIQAWIDSGETEKLVQLDGMQYRNALAAAWGEYLIEYYGYIWRVVNDEYGTEMAIYHPSAQSKVFPFQFLTKAYEQKIRDGVTTLTKQAVSLAQAK